MSWLMRLGLFAGGLVLVLLGMAQLQTGHWVFTNASYHQTTFAASGIGLGCLICLLAFLPPGGWVYRRITTGRKIKKASSKRRLDERRRP